MQWSFSATSANSSSSISNFDAARPLISFHLKLLFFFAPFAIVFSAPAFVLTLSDEILSADAIAAKHASGARDVLYGPGYTNPDARYKLSSAHIHQARVLAIGSSRTLQFRRDLFGVDEATFYNGGLLTERLYELRRALPYLPEKTTTLFVVLDQWSFNANWSGARDNPVFERELQAGQSNPLNALQRSVRLVWPDIFSGKLEPSLLLQRRDAIGVVAATRGDGFRQDGSYVYGAILRDPQSANDYQFKDTLRRIANGANRFEFANDVDQNALVELRLFLAEAKRRNLRVVAVAPPFPPTVLAAMRGTRRHQYIDKVGPAVAGIFKAAGVAFFDFTSCEALGCSDVEFIDGFHPGPRVTARCLAAMADSLPWLDSLVDQRRLRERVANAGVGVELAIEEPQ